MHAHASRPSAVHPGIVLRKAAVLVLFAAGIFSVSAFAQDLSVTLSDSVDPVNAGDLLVYTISFTHNSGGDATDVEVTMFDPDNTTLVNWSVLSGLGWTTTAPIADPSPGGGFGVRFSKNTVAASETASFSVTVRVGSTTPNGTILSGTATVVANEVDPSPGNNTDTEQTTVSTAADLVLAGFNGTPDPVNAGSNITYTYSIVNNGPSSAQTVTVTQAVPANTTFVSANVTLGTGWSVSAPSVGATGIIEFSKGTVILNEGAVFQVVVNVNFAASGSVVSSATIASATTEDSAGNETGNDTVTVNAAPAGLPLISVPMFRW